MTSTLSEPDIEYGLVGNLTDLKYTYRSDIRNRQALEQNFKTKFEALNRVNLTHTEFAKLSDEIITTDVVNSYVR